MCMRKRVRRKNGTVSSLHVVLWMTHVPRMHSGTTVVLKESHSGSHKHKDLYGMITGHSKQGWPHGFVGRNVVPGREYHHRLSRERRPAVRYSPQRADPAPAIQAKGLLSTRHVGMRACSEFREEKGTETVF